MNKDIEIIADTIVVGREAQAKSGDEVERKCGEAGAPDIIATKLEAGEANEGNGWKTVTRRLNKVQGNPIRALKGNGNNKENTSQVSGGQTKKRRAEDTFKIHTDIPAQEEQLQDIKELVLQLHKHHSEARGEREQIYNTVNELQEQIRKLTGCREQDHQLIRALQHGREEDHQLMKTLQQGREQDHGLIKALQQGREEDHKLIEVLQQSCTGIQSCLSKVTSIPSGTDRTWASVASLEPATAPSSSPNVATISAGSSTAPAYKKRTQDDPKTITIFVNMYKGDKQDFEEIKANCQTSMAGFKALKGVRIAYLQPIPNDRINVIFQTEEGATKARDNDKWLKRALPGARMKGETWYPIKCDMVAKRAILASETTNEFTLRQDIEANFAADNGNVERDCTVKRVRWLSKPNPDKTTGSIVLWLKSQNAVNHLIEKGSAIFGACGAFCANYIPADNQGPCYRCNTYGHMQTNCKKAVRCGICSMNHPTRECTNRDKPRCPACAGEHPIMDSQKCPRHPRHFKPEWTRMKPAQKDQHTTASWADEMDQMDSTLNVEC